MYITVCMVPHTLVYYCAVHRNAAGVLTRTLCVVGLPINSTQHKLHVLGGVAEDLLLIKMLSLFIQCNGRCTVTVGDMMSRLLTTFDVV